MCGIAGILKKDGSNVSRDVLIAMRETMIHRGPDDAGIWIDGPIGLAHRRLSILDPSPAGHQPMSDPTGDVFITASFTTIRRFADSVKIVAWP
jgi:asparagine synthase (glutamine-hydrolysing)